MPQGNLKRGFNRLFLVLTILWIVYSALLPLHERSKFFDNFLSQYRQEEADCGLDQSCKQRIEAAESRLFAENSAGKWYAESWPYILILGLGVPPVVYGLIRGVASVSLWIWRGYQSGT